MINLAERANVRNSVPLRFRTIVVYSGWVTVTGRRDGLRRSIPVLRRRAVPIARSEMRR